MYEEFETSDRFETEGEEEIRRRGRFQPARGAGRRPPHRAPWPSWRRPAPNSGFARPPFRWGPRFLGPPTVLVAPPPGPVFFDEPQEPFDDSAPPEGNAWLPLDEEEFHIIRGCLATLRRGTGQAADKVANQAVAVKPGPALLPNGPGLYVIRQNAKVLYVGKAEEGIHKRFMDRFRLFREFNISTNPLVGFEIVPYAFLSNPKTLRANCEIRRGEEGSSVTSPLNSFKGVLAVLEQQFIDALLPTQNVSREKYGGNKISFRIIGRQAGDPPSAP